MGVFGNQGFGIVGGFLQVGQGGGVADIADCDTDVPQQAAAFGSQNGRAGEPGFETGLVQLK